MARPAHYYAETGGFFGFDPAKYFPYNLTRTWHLQLSLFFVVAAYLAAGIFLAPMISGSEPRGQRTLTIALLAALVVVVVGSLIGEAASYKGWLQGESRPLIGAPGLGISGFGPFVASAVGGWAGSLVSDPVSWLANQVQD